MKRQAILLVALLASTALVGCGGKGKKSSSTEVPPASSSSSLEPSSSSDEPSSSSSSAAPSSSSSSAAPSSSNSEAPSSSSSSAAPSSSSEAPSSSSEAPSSSSEAPSSSSSSSSSNLGPTPIIVPEPYSTTLFDNTVKYYPDEILLNHRIASVFVDEEYQLEGLEQFKYTGKNLNFVSNDESIATVSATGVVKGVAAGETVIVVSDKDNPDLKVNVPVIVSAEIDENTAVGLNSDIKTLANAETIHSILDKEMYIKTVYKNGTLHSFDRWDQRITASDEEAYFRIWETDAEIKAEEGAMDFTNYEWVFQTNAYYDTYIYHQSGDVKNYLQAATQSYMSGNNRCAPLLDLLDNIFTSGSALFSNVFKNCKLSWMNTVFNWRNDNDATGVRIGSKGDGSMVFAGTFHITSETADLDDENRYGIPYGTQYDMMQTMRVTVNNNRVVQYAIDLEETYDIGNDHYLEVVHIDHTYEDVNELYIPNKKDYTKVDNIFDL